MKNNLIKSFGFALNGILYILRKERNFKVHIIIFSLAVGCGFLLKINRYDWIAILCISALVLSLETINTAIEKLCDLYSTEQNNTIKQIKDLAAGAVLMAAIFAVIIGLIIFIPYIFNYFTEK